MRDEITPPVVIGPQIRYIVLRPMRDVERRRILRAQELDALLREADAKVSVPILPRRR